LFRKNDWMKLRKVYITVKIMHRVIKKSNINSLHGENTQERCDRQNFIKEHSQNTWVAKWRHEDYKIK